MKTSDHLCLMHFFSAVAAMILAVLDTRIARFGTSLFCPPKMIYIFKPAHMTHSLNRVRRHNNIFITLEFIFIPASHTEMFFRRQDDCIYPIHREYISTKWETTTIQPPNYKFHIDSSSSCFYKPEMGPSILFQVYVPSFYIDHAAMPSWYHQHYQPPLLQILSC